MTESVTSRSNTSTTQIDDNRLIGLTKLSAYFSLENNPLIDIISAGFHSNDFNQTRANYICGRLWLMCLFFATSVLLFSIVDFAMFAPELANKLLMARCLLSLGLFLIAFALKKQPSLCVLRSNLLLAFLLPTLFYVYAMLNFNQAGQQSAPIVYAMMPYLIVTMLGLFPLTILGGMSLITVIFIPFVAFEIINLVGSPWPLLNSIWLFSMFAGISLWLQVSQLSMLMKLYRESTIDPLTKLINRRVLMRMAEKERVQHQIHGTPFSVVMFDLDKFKRINDDYGHPVGDQVLAMTAKVTKHLLTNLDILARFGGEEFVAILPNTKLADAMSVAEKMLATLKAQSIQLPSGETISVTASIGVAEFQAGETVEDVLKRADELLYLAKDGGRDRVVSQSAC